MKYFGFFIIGFLLLVAFVNKPKQIEKDYYTGSLTTGNPDNSYLDTCKVYCCGD